MSFISTQSRGTTRGVSTTFWKTYADVSPALTTAPAPGRVCRAHWPVSLSLPKPRQTPSSHSKALSTTPRCFHRESSSDLISLKVGNKTPGPLGNRHKNTLLCHPRAAFTRRTPGWHDTAGIAPDVRSEQHGVNIRQTPHWLLVDRTQNLFQQLFQQSLPPGQSACLIPPALYPTVGWLSRSALAPFNGV